MKTSLGRGLSSLIPKKTGRKVSLPQGWDVSSVLKPATKENVFNIEIDKIKPNPYQPRKEISREGLKDLADSVREHGILQPLIVSKIEKATEKGQDVEYELIAGERRWRAARMAGLPHVPVIIRGISADKKLAVALVENIQRKDLNALEAALAYRQLQDKFGLSSTEIGKRVGKDRSSVNNTLRLLNLPEDAQEAVRMGKITEGHARAILMAKPGSRTALLQYVLRENPNVRQTEERARNFAAPSITRPKASPKNAMFRILEKDLVQAMGRRVSITQRQGVGHLRIDFASRDELDRLVKFLLGFRR